MTFSILVGNTRRQGQSRPLHPLVWVTPGTVSKHLVHTYRKLRVRGRTAALAALRRTRTT
jgi:hypothetical protein